MAKCPNCNVTLKKDAKFCSNCGEKIIIPTSEEIIQEGLENNHNLNIEYTQEIEIDSDVSKKENEETKPKRKKRTTKPKPEVVEKISENISKYSDGKYRWVYELNLFKNPVILFTVWKIFFFILVGSFIISLFFPTIGKTWGEYVISSLGSWGIGLGVMTVVVFLGHSLYALIMGGKYCVIFEMDEYGITHTQMAKQIKKAEAIGLLTALVGAASGRLTTAAVGLNSSARTSMATEFAKVKKVKLTKFTKIIKLNETLEHNQVYADKDDLDFVLKYIIEHCKNAKNYQKNIEKYCK